MKCVICESHATSLHFGAPSCKACAAFFRRTVALDIAYECLTGRNDCDVNFERRMACKRCRYDKCIRNDMQRELVQSKKGRPSNSASEEAPPWNDETETPSPSTSAGLSSSCSFGKDELKILTHEIMKNDSNLNKSRRMAYTDSRLIDIFSGVCKMPFEKHQLRAFDFRTFNGCQKQEYVIMFNYANSLPGFCELSNANQNYLFRVACGADLVLSSSYYTSRIGSHNNLLISHDGTYVQMVPVPLLGDEPNIAAMFPQKDELEKYKNLIRPKVKMWKEFLPHYEELNLNFEENALLKAIACWHLAQCNYDDDGRKFAIRQKARLLRSLLDLCQESYGAEEGAVKVGNMVLFISLISAQVMELVNTLIVMSFFEILEGDPWMSEILTTRSLFA